ncbi:unnamed protein product [Brassicogethes aeneus]|uniref:Uncharacterized protein n=1 Tax=Brassicogethes aeneus TaxID=1431903 RepID=A0A9P0FQR2_BRAAE|nr:unnamed protein product [Brassicogethes aeneus]
MESCSEITPTESEEDYGSYFLQPASSPYNLAEKLQQANQELVDLNPEKCKTIKVQFKENLVTYEPELTDDDINSIESDYVEVKLEECLEYKTITQFSQESLHLFNINEVEEHFENTIDEDIEEVYDEEVKEELDYEKIEEEHIESSISEATYTEPMKKMSPKQELKEIKKTRKSNNKKYVVHGNIDCKNHCIEQIDHLSMSISKIQIHEKPADCPPLKLRQRKCCNEKDDYNLPIYNGLKSEYGLTLQQLEEKRIMNKIWQNKQLYRQKCLEKARLKRTLQNEENFSQWLRNIQNKNKQNKRVTKPNKKPDVTKILNAEKIYRPSTAKETSKKFTTTNRPYSSHLCVYIEMPDCEVRKNVYIGDLIIQKSKKNFRKPLQN